MHPPQVELRVTPLACELLVELNGSLQLPPGPHVKHVSEVANGIRPEIRENPIVLISSNLLRKRIVEIIVDVVMIVPIIVICV